MRNKGVTSTLIACIALCLVAIIAMTVVLFNGMNNKDTASDISDSTTSVDTADTSSQTSTGTESQNNSSLTGLPVSSVESTASEKNNSVTSSSETSSTTRLPTPDDDPFTGNQQTGERVCYLTFDDGPSGKNSDSVLSILKENDIKATFFVVGYLSTDKIKNVYDAGHAIGLHTYSHDLDKLYASTDAFMEDLTKISNTVYDKTGIRSNLTRFPGGSATAASKKRLGSDGFETVKATLKEQGYTYFDWNLDSGDTHKGTSKDYVINQIRNGIKSNGEYKSEVCILFHDIKKVTVDALPEVIQILKDAGYTFKILDSKCNNYAFR